MTLIIICFFIFVYIVGMYAYIDIKTIKNIKFHKNGFINIGYSTSTHRNITPRNVKMSLLWPFLCIFWIIKGYIWILNNLFNIVLIGLGYCNYKKSKVYNFINRTFE
jgi:hypothetical protein